MNAISFLLIFVSLLSYVAGQLLIKRAMEFPPPGEKPARLFWTWLTAGIGAMTVSFFLTLGLLRHLDLSYFYPFQGLSVILISVLAAALLKERLTLRLAAGAAAITAGVILVFLS